MCRNIKELAESESAETDPDELWQEVCEGFSALAVRPNDNSKSKDGNTGGEKEARIVYLPAPLAFQFLAFLSLEEKQIAAERGSRKSDNSLLQRRYLRAVVLRVMMRIPSIALAAICQLVYKIEAKLISDAISTIDDLDASIIRDLDGALEPDYIRTNGLRLLRGRNDYSASKKRGRFYLGSIEDRFRHICDHLTLESAEGEEENKRLCLIDNSLKKDCYWVFSEDKHKVLLEDLIDQQTSDGIYQRLALRGRRKVDREKAEPIAKRTLDRLKLNHRILSAGGLRELLTLDEAQMKTNLPNFSDPRTPPKPNGDQPALPPGMPPQGRRKKKNKRSSRQESSGTADLLRALKRVRSAGRSLSLTYLAIKANDAAAVRWNLLRQARRAITVSPQDTSLKLTTVYRREQVTLALWPIWELVEDLESGEAEYLLPGGQVITLREVSLPEGVNGIRMEFCYTEISGLRKICFLTRRLWWRSIHRLRIISQIFLYHPGLAAVLIFPNSGDRIGGQAGKSGLVTPARYLAAWRQSLFFPARTDDKAGGTGSALDRGTRGFFEKYSRLQQGAAILILLALIIVIVLKLRPPSSQVTVGVGTKSVAPSPTLLRDREDKTPAADQKPVPDHSPSSRDSQLPGQNDFAQLTPPAEIAQLIEQVQQHGKRGAGAKPGSSFDLIEPIATYVISPTPKLRWEPVDKDAQYHVEVFDKNLYRVRHPTILGETEWTIDPPLQWGEQYSWQVKAYKDGLLLAESRLLASLAVFMVIEKSRADEISRDQKKYAGDPVTLARFYIQAGLLDDAEQSLIKSAKAPRLLKKIKGLRGRK